MKKNTIKVFSVFLLVSDLLCMSELITCMCKYVNTAAQIQHHWNPGCVIFLSLCVCSSTGNKAIRRQLAHLLLSGVGSLGSLGTLCIVWVRSLTNL